jgi:hypothetical protein
MLLEIIKSLDTGSVFAQREPAGYLNALQQKLETLGVEFPALADLCSTALLALAVTRDSPQVAMSVAIDMISGEQHDPALSFEVPTTLRHLYDQIAAAGSNLLLPSPTNVTDTMRLWASVDETQGHESDHHQCGIGSDGTHLYVHTKDMLFKVGTGQGIDSSAFGEVVNAAPIEHEGPEIASSVNCCFLPS